MGLEQLGLVQEVPRSPSTRWVACDDDRQCVCCRLRIHLLKIASIVMTMIVVIRSDTIVIRCAVSVMEARSVVTRVCLRPSVYYYEYPYGSSASSSSHKDIMIIAIVVTITCYRYCYCCCCC